MSRKPAHVVAAHPKPQGRPAIWAAIRKLRSFTVREINRETDVNERTIAGYLKGLEAAGFLTSSKDGKAARRYELTRDVGVEAPRVREDGSVVIQGDGNERLWRTMKRLKQFTAVELAVTASLPERPVSPETAKDYCQWLRRAGYIGALDFGGPGRAAVYRFIRDSGPKPPQIQRIAQVFDPNTGEVVYQHQRAAS